MARVLAFASFSLIALLSACQPSVGVTRPRTGFNVITREQIDSSHATNVYDVIAKLHAEYLHDRGAISVLTNQHDRAVVFLNDQEYGILETMRNIPPANVAEIRFFSGTDAVTRFGSQYGGGVIQLISRTQ